MKYQEAEYKFFEHHSTWVQAQRICSWFQAELASVHGEAELRFLGQNLKKVPGGWGPPGGHPRAPLPPQAAPSPASFILCWRDVIWGKPGSAGVLMGLVWWRQVPASGCRFGALRGDAFFAAVQAAGGGCLVPRVATVVSRDTQSLQGTDVSSPGVQFSRGQEQHWWIGLHTYENDGRFK